MNFQEDYLRQQYTQDKELEYDPADTDKFKDENMYKYHDNTQPFEPGVQPYSYFYITLAGQIEFGEFMELDGLALSYCFVSGDDWNIAGGDKAGSAQHSFKSVAGSKKMVWDLPFEITYRSMTPHGWPQLVLYCTSKDSDGDQFVRAYGCAHMPLQPGTHSKTVRMFTPIA